MMMMMMRRAGGNTVQVLVLLIWLLEAALASLSHAHIWWNNGWVNHGNGIWNHRSSKGPGQRITPHTISKLAVKWKFSTGFDVSATPSVADGAVYFPGWNGMLYAVEEETGALIWQRNLTELAGEVTGGSRATPVVWEEVLLVGLLGPAVVLALNRHSGHLLWKSHPLDSAAHAVITMSGTPYQGFYYVGVSSLQEGNTCCTFQGSFQKISIKDGKVIWRTSMLPPDSGYYGAAVWGSSPSIDTKRRLVFIATGNNYEVPRSVQECENNRLNSTIETEPDSCLDPLNHQDSMMALSLDSGAIVWSRNLQAYDVWTVACQFTPTTTPNCPSVLGPDYDFGEAPMLIYLDNLSHHYTQLHKTCLVVAGQKSGVIWALDCDTGSIVWSTVAGPGGYLGGASWGLSTDGERVYTNIINNEGRNFTLAPGTEVTKGGGWVAMEARTGKVVWSVAEPSGVSAFGPTSVAEGVVFGTSFTDEGDIYALDALTGTVLWHTTTGAGMYGGVSITNSCVFIGNGYHNFPIFQQNGTAVTAFCLPTSIP